MLHGKVGWQTCAALKTDLCYNVYAPTGTLEDPRVGIDNIKPWVQVGVAWSAAEERIEK